MNEQKLAEIERIAKIQDWQPEGDITLELIKELRAELAKSEWISIDDRVPSKSMDCLCYDARQITHFIASWYKEKWHVLSNVPCSALWRVTHWMPLPKPPKNI